MSWPIFIGSGTTRPCTMSCWASPSTDEEDEEQEVPHASPRERSLNRGSSYALPTSQLAGVGTGGAPTC